MSCRGTVSQDSSCRTLRLKNMMYSFLHDKQMSCDQITEQPETVYQVPSLSAEALSSTNHSQLRELCTQLTLHAAPQRLSLHRH